MPDYPQGTAHFSGINDADVLGAQMTLSTGITPSVCIMRIVPTANAPAAIGLLRFAYGGRDVIRFPDAAVREAVLRVAQSGHYIELQIVDRRWEWQYGSIDGHYNVRNVLGDLIPQYRKTPQELARMLLLAMGESNFDIQRLPNNGFPEVNWVAANPAAELASLCEQLSCRIVLNLDSSITLAPIGKGFALPDNGRQINAGFATESKIAPSAIRLVGAPIRYQCKVRLEAVGKDTDGKIKVIDDLSYKPDGGWKIDNPKFFANVSNDEVKVKNDQVRPRILAFESVYRWYRIKQQVGGGGVLAPPGFKGELRNVNDLLPILAYLCETEKAPNGEEVSRPAYVQGLFWLEGHDQADSKACTKYPHDIGIDGERGLVIFPKPVYRIGDNGFEEAELYLTCSLTVTDPQTNTKVYYEKQTPVPGANPNAPVRTIHRPDVELRITSIYKPCDKFQNTETNEKDAVKQANYYLDAAVAEYQLQPSLDVEYEGILSINIDGAIQQVSWQVGDNRPAITRASRNTEHDMRCLSWAERRRRERDQQNLNRPAGIGNVPMDPILPPHNPAKRIAIK